MAFPTPGRGAMYVVGQTDSSGTPLSGGSNYHLDCRPMFPSRISGR